MHLVFLSSITLCPFSSYATVVENIHQTMTNLLGHQPAVTSVYDAQLQGLDAGAPSFQPWSSSYWPDILGNIENHYRDRTRVGNELFFLLQYGNAKNRFQSDAKNVCEKYNQWNPDDLNKKLSPAEKYDLLLGDTHFSFSKAIMDEIEFRSKHQKAYVTYDGKEINPNNNYDGDDNTELYADVQGTYSSFDVKYAYQYWKNKNVNIAYWSGICDGWSPASVFLPRPVNSVTVTGALGHQITFYPDDLKALGDYLFARTNSDYMQTMNYQFAGRPCGTGGNPEVIPDGQPNAGRVKDFRCNDVDAGVWHLALLNRVGKDKMGFVFEIDNNRKINNHPVSNYSLKYFNPSTGKEGSLRDSIVPRTSLYDSYANRRNPNSVYLVGVKSKFRYLNYQWPESHHSDGWTHDGPSQDDVKEKEYTYDLELDANGNILGGEWGSRFKEKDQKKSIYADQPDFIWMAAPQNLPHSEMSIYTNPGATINSSNPRPFGNTNWAWDGRSALPEDWVNAAKKDEMWRAPVVGELRDIPGSSVKDVFPPQAKDDDLSKLKAAQPLSDIVFYLFDQARDPDQK